jgi:inosine-uridine nucleoside N-ribohydrolase
VAACALDPSLIAASETAHVDVDTSWSDTAGQAIAAQPGERRANADLVLDARIPEFLERLLDRIGRVAAG